VDNSFNPPSHFESEITLGQQIQDLKEKYFSKDIDKCTWIEKKVDKVEVEDAANTKHKRKNEFPKILSEI